MAQAQIIIPKPDGFYLTKMEEKKWKKIDIWPEEYMNPLEKQRWKGNKLLDYEIAMNPIRRYENSGKVKQFLWRCLRGQPELPLTVLTPEQVEKRLAEIKTDKEREVPLHRLKETGLIIPHNKLEIVCLDEFSEMDVKLYGFGWGNINYKHLIDRVLERADEIGLPYAALSKFQERLEPNIGPLARLIPYTKTLAHFYAERN
jgi:hypothetical protein